MELMLAHPDYAVSVSWGKDSVAMLHAAAMTLGHVIAVHGRYSPQEELPDIPLVRDAVLSVLGDRITYIEVKVWGDWELYKRAGRFFWKPETSEDRALLRAWKDDFVRTLEDAARQAGARGMMIGMCAHESKARRINIAMRGEAYQAKDRLPTLLPLARWSADDVCAYHAANGLPWLRIYDVAADPRTARSELSFATGGGDAIRRHGAFAEWEAAYPSLVREWAAVWPIK
jgi:3'-phosphoadenosine 5'-phosphosulfate sulfotransferase (PAPS reductase)/FAD synthetase